MDKVLIVDDHPLVQWALRGAVQSLFPQAQVQVFGTSQALREYLQRSGGSAHPDLVLLDLELPDEKGLALLELLCQRDPRPTVLLMSDGEPSGDAVQAVDVGAMGFLPKRLTIDEFKDAILLALDGLVFFPPTAPDPPPDNRSSDTSYQTLTDLGELGFTPRQADVVSLIIQGQQNKQIAQTMGVTPDTVKDHVKAVLRVLGVQKRSDVVLAVAELQKRQRDSGRSAATLLPAGADPAACEPEGFDQTGE